MQINISPTQGLLDLTLPVLAPRSRLYSLEPIGIGTELVESLTGYIARLAEAHHLSVAILFGYELAPLARKEYLRRAALRSKYPCRILASAFLPQARAMNGAGVGASEWVQILQSLTLRTELQFLTMLTWKAVFPQGQLLRPMRAWCPVCYEQWRIQSKTIYEPLLWAIKAITVCPQHHQPLRTVCNHCNRPLYPLASRSRPGFCSMCKKWLGEVRGSTSNSEHYLGEDAREQIWSSHAIGELLATAPQLAIQPKRESILNSLRNLRDGHTGNIPAFAKALHINKATLWYWYKGKNVPQVQMLLKLCLKCKVSLLDFVLGKITSRCDASVTKSSFADSERTCSPIQQRKKVNKAEVKEILQATIKEIPPPSLQKVASMLGHDANTFRYWYPNICKEVVIRYKEHKKNQSCETWEKVKSSLQSSYIEEYPPPSLTEVARRLKYDVKTLLKLLPNLCHDISARFKEYRTSYWAEIKTKMQLALIETPPQPILTIAKRFMLSKSSLYKHFPKMCHDIAARHKEYRKRCLQEQKAQFLKQVQHVALALYKAGIYPSIKRVEAHLAKSLTNNKMALTLLREIRKQLGLNSLVFRPQISKQ